MADKKVTQLSALTTPAGADLLHVIDDVAGTPVNKKMEISALFANIPSVVALGGTPQAITGTGVTVNATTSITTIALSGNTDATGTMANGATVGQLKIIVVTGTQASAKYTLNPTSTNFNGFSSITLGKLGDAVILVWAGSKWNIIGRQGATETPQALSGAGAIDITSPITYLTTTGSNALTLGHGIEGQTKTILMVTDGGAGTMTKANGNLGITVANQIVWDDVGESVTLLYTGSAWEVINRCGVNGADGPTIT